MSERLLLAVDDGAVDLMSRLGGGERKRGLWLSQMVRIMADQQSSGQGSDLESLRLGFAGLAGEVHTLKGHMARLEQRVETLVDDWLTGKGQP